MIAKINDRFRENYRTKTLTKRNYLKIFVGGFRKKKSKQSPTCPVEI
jgi:hypothetical protein